MQYGTTSNGSEVPFLKMKGPITSKAIDQIERGISISINVGGEIFVLILITLKKKSIIGNITGTRRESLK